MALQHNTARSVGILILMTIFTYHMGDYLAQSLENSPNVLADLSISPHILILSLSQYLITAVAFFTIAAVMFPYFRSKNEPLALMYIGSRLIECFILLMSCIILYSLVYLSKSFIKADDASLAAYAISKDGIWNIHWSSMKLLMVFFSISSMLFYFFLYQWAMVPLFLSLWGLGAAILMLVETLLKYIGLSLGIGIWAFIPIGVNELVLSVWLMWKGCKC